MHDSVDSHVISLHTLSIHELLILAYVLACTGCNWNGEVGARTYGALTDNITDYEEFYCGVPFA